MKIIAFVFFTFTTFFANASAISDVLKNKADADLATAIRQLQADFPNDNFITAKDVKDSKAWGRKFYGKGIQIGSEGKVSCLKAKSDLLNKMTPDELVKSYDGSEEQKSLLTADLDAVFSALGDHLAAGCMSKRM